MASLDTAIVNVGAPEIQRSLGLSGAMVQAAVGAYLLVYAVGLVPAARLGGRLGAARVFRWGVAVFATASLACGLAQDPAMLVLARAVQGAGAALLVPQVLSLVQRHYEGPARRRAVAAYGAVLALGVAAGQVLGGTLVAADLWGVGWRAIFLVNLPVAATVLLVAPRLLPPDQVVPDQVVVPDRRLAVRDPRASHLDVVGVILLAAGVVALLLPLMVGPGSGWPAWCWAVLAGGAAVLLGFGAHEARVVRRGSRPLLDPAMLTDAAVRRGLAAAFVLMGCYGAMLFVLSLYLQREAGAGPLRAGLTFAPYALGFAGASLTWARLPARWHELVPVVGLGVLAAAVGALAAALAAGPWPPVADVLLVLAGAGHGAGFGASVRSSVEHVRARYADAVGGVLSTVTQLAIAAGVATLGSLYLAGTDVSVVLRATAVPAAAAALVLVPGAVRRARAAHRGDGG
jgi:MFS family permease